MTYYLGVDIGGTFTDCVAVDDAGRVFHAKTPSTHESGPADGVLAGLELLAAEVGVSTAALCEEADRLGHGTTIGTNLIVERKGARVALLATAGPRRYATMNPFTAPTTPPIAMAVAVSTVLAHRRGSVPAG